MPMIFLIAIGILSMCAMPFLPEGERRYPVGHVHEYDPTGEYTYKHQNPKFKENA